MLKKLTSILLIVALLICNTGTIAFAETMSVGAETSIVDDGKCGENLTWTLYENGTLEITGTGDMYDFTSDNMPEWSSYINSTYELKNLVLNEGITSIGDYAFQNCSGFTDNLVIPNSVRKIGTGSFYKCNGFEGDLIIPESVERIGSVAFLGCTGFDGVLELSSNLKSIGSGAFEDCSGLKGDIIIPTTTTSIGDFAFYGCSALETVKILNPSVSIESSKSLPNTIKIYAYKDSTAHQYAVDNNLEFEEIPGVVAYGTSLQATWVLTEDGTMTISGAGKMDDYLSTQTPWSSYEAQIKTLIVEKDITYIGFKAFNKCQNLEKVYIYNVDCSIPVAPVLSFVETATIYGYVDSTAMQYAKDSGNAFECIIHVWEEDATVDIKPTCTVDGQESIYCSICGIKKSNSTTVLPAIGHKWDDGLVIKEATSEEVGVRKFTCDTCGETKNEDIPVLQNPSGKCGDNLTWTLYEDGTLVISGTGDMYDYGILGGPWCEEYKSELKKLVLTEGVTTIGLGAFYECSELSGNLIIPEGVTAIGKHAFSGCSGFDGDLVIPEGVTTIGNFAFTNCSGFDGNLVIPESVTTIGMNAFFKCSGFTGNLVIPKGVKTIEDYTFYLCSGFDGNLVIPEGVTAIGDYAFFRCGGFTGNLVIPKGVTTIGDDAFQECSSFDGSLVISEGVTTIGKNAFYACSGFTGNLVISEGVREIGNAAFYGCSGLTGDLVIPKGVTAVGDSAFSGCNGFDGNLVIPEGVTVIGRDAFFRCSGFTGNLVIPEGVTTIGSRAFSGCSGFDGNLVISKGATTIEEDTFYECSGFTGNLIIPEGVTAIGDYAFFGCSGFDGNLVIPEGVTTIGRNAFYKCSGFTGDLVIPEGVTTVGVYAFSGCKGFAGNLVIPEGVTTIESNVFSGCSGFAGNLVIPESVTEIETSAFDYCRGFTGKLVIPEGVTAIGDFAFYECSGFDGSLVIPQAVTTIGKCAFYGCSGFDGSLVIPKGVTAIPMYAFCYCSGLTGNLVIPESVTEIGNYAFSGCRSFTGDLVIPESVNSVGIAAFDPSMKLSIHIAYSNAEYIVKYAKRNSLIYEVTGVDTNGYEGIYDGNAHTITVTVPENVAVTYALLEDGEYTFEVPTFTDAGEVTIYYKVIKGSTEMLAGYETISILKKSIEEMEVELEYESVVYDGTEKTPKVEVEGLSASDYKVAYSSNVNEGTATVTITGIGNYEGEITKTFVIEKAAMGVTAYGYEGIYDGNAHSITVTAPEGAAVTYSLTEEGEYSSKAPTLTNVGSKTVYYKVEKANYLTVTGSEVVIITKKSVNDMEINLEYESVVYDGTEKTPNVEGLPASDYEVVYSSNVNAGTATVTITGVGNYEGEITKTFVIKKASMKVIADGYKGVYDGNAHSIKVTAPEGATVTYSLTEEGEYNSEALTLKNAGTLTVYYKVVKNNYETVVGSETVAIAQKSIADIDVALEYETVVHNGEAKTPTVTVDGLTADDYTVTYTNNINPGTASVTITGKGNYTGTIIKNFEIKAKSLETPTLKAATVSSTGKVSLSWNAVEGATNYVIYRSAGNDSNYKKYTTRTATATSYTDTKAKAGIKYYYKIQAINEFTNSNWSYASITCDLARPTLKATNVASTGKIKLSWAAVEGATGYEIYRSTGNDDNYKKYTTRTATATSYTDTKAKAGIKYYYRIRAIYSSNTSANSAWDYENISCDLARPTLKATNVASTGKIKLSWATVEGATGYEIYRSTGNDDNYKKYTTRTATATSYTDSKAKAGIKYYYRIRAIYSSNTSANSAWDYENISCDLAKPKITVSATKKPGKLYVTWAEVDGASSYVIYRATSKNGTYKKYSTTTKTAYTNTSVTKGKTYYYKVVAVYKGNSAANSAYSNIGYAKVK